MRNFDMRRRSLHALFATVIAAIALSLASSFMFPTPATAQVQGGRAGLSQPVQGISVTLDELRRRAAAQRPVFAPRQASPRRTFNGLPLSAPVIPATTASQAGSAPPVAPQMPPGLADE